MSSGSESDEEYVPEEPEQLSEEDSDDDKTEAQNEHERKTKTNKRKIREKTQGGKKRNVANQSTEETPIEESKNVINFEQQPSEEQKKKDDELWAKFLEGTDSKPKTKAELKLMPKEMDNLKTDSDVTLSATSNGTKSGKDTKADIKAKEARIFEFAGETVVVEGSVIKKTLPTTSNDPGVKDLHPVPKRSGGLSDLVGQLTKKNKLTTLEKSKLDWETFKQKEGIDEDLKTLNRGKDGYLERQEFLQRTDVRQYELEREVRMSRRSNR